MADLGSCHGGISGEHLISEGVIRVLTSTSGFSVSGLPWLEPHEERLLAPKNLTANCLCRTHNSALSPLDEAAQAFFAQVRSGLERERRDSLWLLSGHDLERWLLKTVKAMASSRNLAHEGARLSGAFAKDVDVLNMLDDVDRWPVGTGLYCVMPAGATFENHLRFQLYPLTNDRREISGVGVNILGLQFLLFLEPPDIRRSPQLNGAKFRPGEIAIQYPSVQNRILLSWRGAATRRDKLSVRFMRPVGPQ